MYRSAIIFLSILLFVLVLLTGSVFFLFSSTGDEISKPFLKQLIEEKSGLPVEIKTYRLRAGVLELDLVLDKHLEVRTKARYDLFSRTFEGVYHINAKDFRYEEIRLSEADIRGRYKGIAEDIFVTGKGTALHAPVTYKLRLIENEPQQIEATAKEVALQELLALVSQPPLAKGKVDVRVNMPHIGQKGAKGSAQVLLKKALFNRALIKKQYGVELPKTSLLSANANAILNGNEITFKAVAKSKLFSFSLQKGTYLIDSKDLKSRYVADVKEMRLFSHNKLSGPLHVEGRVEGKGEKVALAGESRSLGGVLRFEKAEAIKVSMKGLSLGKVLHFMRQPAYAEGVLHGEILLDDAVLKKGHYRIDLKQGSLNDKVIKKRLGYIIPKQNHLTLHSEGKIENEILRANVKLDATLLNATLEGLTYNMKTGQLKSPYHLTLHDIESLGKGRQPRKNRAVMIDGQLRYGTKDFSVSGKAKGLGKKAAFSYTGKHAELDAAGIYIGRVLVLAGLPHYLNGMVNTQVKLTDIAQMNGSFSFKGNDLVTEPKVMKALLGKPVKIKLSVSAKGVMKKHKAYADASVKMPLGNMQLKKIIFDLNHNTMSAQYHVKMPDLKKLTIVSDIRLYGALVLDGILSLKKVLTVTGQTHSLGGKVTYRLIGDRFSSDVKAVPLPNILKLTGYPRSFLGSVSGTTVYNLNTQKGRADLKITSFQIKPSDLTRMLTPILGKDPARIIFKTTTFHAKINKDIVTYRLIAKSAHSAIELTDGWVNQKSKQQRAKLKFVYGKYTVYGTIRGTTEYPKIKLDTSKLIKDKLEGKLQKKVEKKFGKDVGALLKGFGL